VWAVAVRRGIREGEEEGWAHHQKWDGQLGNAT
jgi:hypothetical protein